MFFASEPIDDVQKGQQKVDHGASLKLLKLEKLGRTFFQEERIAILWIFSSSVPCDLAPLKVHKEFLQEDAVHFFEKQLKYKIIVFCNIGKIDVWILSRVWAQCSLLWKFNTFGQSQDYSPLTCPIYSNQPKAIIWKQINSNER